MTGGINDGQFPRSENERNKFEGPGSEVNALETFQGADRRAIDSRVREIEFDDFVAFQFRGVFYASGNIDGRIARNFSKRGCVGTNILVYGMGRVWMNNRLEIRENGF